MGPNPDDLIQQASTGSRILDEDELNAVLTHVAAAGFDPTELETARSAIAGQEWQGRTVAASDRLPPEIRHYLLHVIVNQEWPTGTGLAEYVRSIREVVLDPTSGIFTNEYGGTPALGVIRASRELRGPGGYDWVLVQYRVRRGHWTTAFQPVDGLDELEKLEWGTVRWLRAPTRAAESRSG